MSVLPNVDQVESAYLHFPVKKSNERAKRSVPLFSFQTCMASIDLI